MPTLILLALAPLACRDKSGEDTADGALWSFSELAALDGELEAFAAVPDGGGWAVAGGTLYEVSPGGDAAAVDRGDLPDGTVTFLGFLPGDAPRLFARVHGRGLYRADAGGGSWTLAEDGLSSAILSVLNPDAVPVPLKLTPGDAADTAWLAAAGGLFHSEDGGASWSEAAVATSGNVNVLFTDVHVAGDTLVASAFLPESIIPADFAGVLGGTVFRSDDGGDSWEDAAPDLPSFYAAGVTLDDAGALYVATMDEGVLVEDGEGGWQPVGGPSDAVGVEWTGGGLSVASATRGLWRLDGETWSHAGEGPAVGVDGALGATVDGALFALGEGEGDPPPEDAGGSVHVALSFHVNYYHSYRGDTPDDDGFGLDIDVMRDTLDWMDEWPEVRGDWDMENAFSTDDWMQEHSPDILERIAARVDDGSGDVRLMSWNNGAMASSTREEFGAAVARAWESNRALFSEVVDGVQPQECMFSPDHLAWYPEEGVSWVTLFNAANGFTALREDTPIQGEALYNPFTLEDPITGATMLTVPVYHHADVMEHGGLKGWIRQLSASYPGDTLLVVHFDADGETWERFDLELSALGDEVEVTWTTIADYLADHGTVDSYPFYGDVADGTGDGFQSWAEKDFNHRQFTEVVKAREAAAVARFLGGGDAGVEAALEDALTPRLQALSTTNYGLAAPYLHEDRIASAEAQAAEANALSQEALALAEALSPPAPGTLELVNARESAGPALVEFSLTLPEGAWEGPEGLTVWDADGELPVTAALTESGPDGDVVAAALVAEVEASSIRTLSWSYDPASPATASGGLTEADVAYADGLAAPFTECAGGASGGALTAENAVEADARGLWARQTETWELAACDGAGEVQRAMEAWAGLPGVVVRVSAAMGEASDPETLESVALTPLACAGEASELRWRSFGGVDRSRPARQQVETWNGQSADGQLGLICDDGTALWVSHRVTERTSIGFGPLRNIDGQAVLAPLGTLWGDGPWHESRRTGGHGMGDLVTAVVGSQFAPAAPDWSGAQIEYTLLVGEDLDPEVLDLFAHPPYVRVGAPE
jgi:hypothetical protein